MIQEKINAFKVYGSDSNNTALKNRLTNLQVRVKEKFYCKIASKLSDNQKNAKAYWSLIKMFLNNKEIPLVPPLYDDDCFTTDFKEKAELFNSYFFKQFSLISDNSLIPSCITYATEKRLSTVALSVGAIDLQLKVYFKDVEQQKATNLEEQVF